MRSWTRPAWPTWSGRPNACRPGQGGTSTPSRPPGLKGAGAVRIYMDHAATTPLRHEVLEAMLPYLTQVYGNASSFHAEGQAARHALDGARATVAGLRSEEHTSERPSRENPV